MKLIDVHDGDMFPAAAGPRHLRRATAHRYTARMPTALQHQEVGLDPKTEERVLDIRFCAHNDAAKGDAYGATVNTLLALALDRLDADLHPENAVAAQKLIEARMWLDRRDKRVPRDAQEALNNADALERKAQGGVRD